MRRSSAVLPSWRIRGMKRMDQGLNAPRREHTDDGHTHRLEPR